MTGVQSRSPHAPFRGPRLWRSRAVALATLAVLSAAAPADDDHVQMSIKILSSQPYLVSGGNTLAEVSVPHHIPLQDVRVQLNGMDVTSAFRSVGARTLEGVVSGLKLGSNELEAGVKTNHAALAKLTLTNYPIKGPMLSGPYTEPFICQTQSFMLPDGTPLGPSLDADCSAATRITYVYRSTAGTYKPLTSTTSLPSDVVNTTTSAGATVPYVVRVETGTMNRGIYQNAILFNPLTDAAPSPFSPPKGWNHRLVAIHGAGCPGGWYTQGAAEGVNVLQDMYLSKGYA